MLPQSLPFCPRYFWRYSAVPIDHSTQFFPFHFSSFLYVWTRGVPYYQSPQPLKINKIKIWRRKVADEKPAHTEKDKKNQKKEVEAETAAPALAVLYKSRPPSAPPLPFPSSATSPPFHATSLAPIAIDDPSRSLLKVRRTRPSTRACFFLLL
jgi:hypothetical protein